LSAAISSIDLMGTSTLGADENDSQGAINGKISRLNDGIAILMLNGMTKGLDQREQSLS
jgi:hypothetical protein